MLFYLNSARFPSLPLSLSLSFFVSLCLELKQPQASVDNWRTFSQFRFTLLISLAVSVCVPVVCVRVCVCLGVLPSLSCTFWRNSKITEQRNADKRAISQLKQIVKSTLATPPTATPSSCTPAAADKGQDKRLSCLLCEC